MSRPQNDLIDRGFEQDFSPERLEALNKSFGSEVELQRLVYEFHEQDHAIDMKRGEFYPEILRCIVSMKRAIAAAYEIDLRCAHPNFGSNGSIDTILLAMKLREIQRGVDPKTTGGMLVATPTYFRNYNSCASKRLRMMGVPLRRPGFEFDLPAMLQALERENPTVVFLVTPDNPSGRAISDEAIHTMLEAVPAETLVVMDRTLANIEPEISSSELLRDNGHRQLAILHSLSKYSGLSHLRVGFALYSRLDLAEEIRPLLPLGLGVEGAVKATIELAGGPIRPSSAVLDNIRRSKALLSEFCEAFPDFRYTDFSGNYCLLLLPQGLTAQEVDRHLSAAGVYVMSGEDLPEPMPDVVRLHTGGQPGYMDRTLVALRQLVSSSD